MVFESLRAELQLDTSGFRSSVRDARSDMDGLADRMSSTGRSMQRAGAVATAGITAPLTALAAGSAGAAASFEDNMQQSIAVMGGVSDSMREDLEQTARDVATSMSVSHEEAAQSFFFLASAGLEAEESIEAMPQVAALAEAGQLDMAQATDVATNVMSAFGKEASELADVTDLLVGANTRHNQSVQDMADAFSVVAPTAAGMGFEMDELSAAIGQLGDVGLSGQRAGTGLNTVLAQMADEAGPAATQMREMGVSVRDSEGEMLPLVDIIRQFEQAGADAGDMAALFGTRGGPTMSALLQQGSDALAENRDELNELEGVTQNVAETQRDTFNAQLGILRSNITDAGIAIGKDLLPLLTGLVNRLQPAAEWFQNLGDRQRQVILVVGALLAAIGPLLLALGTMATLLPVVAAGAGVLTGAVGLLTTALGLLSAPILAIVAAFALLAIAWQTDFLGFQTKTKEAVSAIIGYLRPFINIIGGELVAVFTTWRNVAEGVFGWFVARWEEHGDTVMAVVGPILNFLSTAFDATFGAIITVVDTVLRNTVDLISALLSLARGDFEGFRDGIGSIVQRTVELILAPFEWLYNQLVGNSLIPDLLSDIIAAITGWDVAGAFGDAVDGALSTLTGFVGDFKDAGANLVGAVGDGIKDGVKGVGDAASDIAGAARDKLPFSPAKEGPLSDLDKAGPGLVDTFASGIEDSVRRVDSASNALAGAARPAGVPAPRGRRNGRDTGGSGGDVIINIDTLNADNPRSAARELKREMRSHNLTRSQ